MYRLLPYSFVRPLSRSARTSVLPVGGARSTAWPWPFLVERHGREGPDILTTDRKQGGTMEQIALGRSDLKVSRIAFGTWQLGGDC